MIFYKVSMVGDGSEVNPFRPDIPDNIAYVWSDNACGTCDTYILATNMIAEGLELVSDLLSACKSRNLNITDVENWFVGD